MDVDRHILAAVTRRGRRPLTHAELVEAGATNKEIEGRCRRGTLQRVHDEVYLVGAGDLAWHEQLLAGVLAGGETAAASRYSALRLWGLTDYAPQSVHVEVTHGTTLTAAGVTRHRTRRGVPTTVIDGIRVVRLEEALLQLAARASRREVHRQLTTAWRMRKTTPDKVLAHLERHGGRGVRGLRRLREVAALYAASSRGPGSEAESDFLHDFLGALEAAGIERPELQYVIDIRGGDEKVVPDFAWPRRRKVVEMKGLSAQDGTRVVFHRGSEADWGGAPATRAGERHRFAGSGSRLLPLGVPFALRVVAGSGGVMHERWFRPPGDYTAVPNARVLRKADGTEWAFVVPSAGGVGSALAARQYRLRASFRRDNTAAAPGSLVLSQAGDTGTEEVVLDIP